MTKVETRLSFNRDDTLDEIVADEAYVHLEQMTPTSYWMQVTVDGETHTIWFQSSRKITVTHRVEAPDV